MKKKNTSLKKIMIIVAVALLIILYFKGYLGEINILNPQPQPSPSPSPSPSPVSDGSCENILPNNIPQNIITQKCQLDAFICRYEGTLEELNAELKSICESAYNIDSYAGVDSFYYTSNIADSYNVNVGCITKRGATQSSFWTKKIDWINHNIERANTCSSFTADFLVPSFTSNQSSDSCGDGICEFSEKGSNICFTDCYADFAPGTFGYSEGFKNKCEFESYLYGFNGTLEEFNNNLQYACYHAKNYRGLNELNGMTYYSKIDQPSSVWFKCEYSMRSADGIIRTSSEFWSTPAINWNDRKAPKSVTCTTLVADFPLPNLV